MISSIAWQKSDSKELLCPNFGKEEQALVVMKSAHFEWKDEYANKSCRESSDIMKKIYEQRK